MCGFMICTQSLRMLDSSILASVFSGPKTTQFLVVLACTCFISVFSNIAHADEGEYQLFVSGLSGITLERDVSNQVMVLTRFASGLNENIDLVSELSFRTPSDFEPSWAMTGGLSAKLDVLTVVPFVGLTGGIESTQGGIGALMRIFGGLDYFLSRSVSAGLMYQARLLDSFEAGSPPSHWFGLRIGFHGEWP